MKKIFITIHITLSLLTCLVLHARDNHKIVANPLNLNYRFMTDEPSRREAADPEIHLFKGKYYLFASKSGGYWRSDDLAEWTYIPCRTISTIENYAPTIMALGDTLYYLASGSKTIHYTTNPDRDEWKPLANCQYEFTETDPAFFHDPETGRTYVYFGCSNRDPIRGVEVLPSQGFKAVGQPVTVIDHHTDMYGWEIPGERNEKNGTGWNEGATMLKHNGKYYLQYASPGTEYRTYADGVYVGNTPLGPFTYMENSPFSIKPGGFVGGAGHGQTFKDKYGNFWHIATMKISRRHSFERRLGLFPVYFDADQMHAQTVWSDYPFFIPDKATDFKSENISMKWHLLSYDKMTSASSHLPGFEPAKAVNENIEQWWSAKTGNVGEWLQVDLGEKVTVHAIQVNFADEGFTNHAGNSYVSYRYRIESSDDGKEWKTLTEKTDTKDMPHQLIVPDNPAKARFLRITNTANVDGRFSLSGFRIFGQGNGTAPDKVTGLRVERQTDRRRFSLKWDKLRRVTGYIVRWGISPDRLNNAVMVFDNTFEAGYFNRDSEYYFSVTAFNENGSANADTNYRLPDEQADRLYYDRDFAPSEGYVNKMEQSVRAEICLNGYWDFQPVSLPPDYRQGKGVAPELPLPQADKWDVTQIKIPSPWNINSFANASLEGPDHRNYPSYPKAWEAVKMAWMRKTATIPADWNGRRTILHFEAVAGQTQVLVNGVKVAENFDLFLPFDVDITDYIQTGETAEILVGVRSQSLFEDSSTKGRRIVPAGSMWGYHVNGIWQDVYLLAIPAVHIDNVFIKPLVSQNMLELDLVIDNLSGKKTKVHINGDVRKWINKAGTSINLAPEPAWELAGLPSLVVSTRKLSLVPGKNQFTLKVNVKTDDLEYWTPEHPNLYGLTLQLTDAQRKKPSVTDIKYERFGWREWTFDADRQLLNGKIYPLKGDSWHFMGIPQLTRRYAWSWFTALKDANANAVRPHAQVYPRFYFDVADEMGICILAETANWASDGGPKMDAPAFWENSKEHLKRMVIRDRNHPSVFGWSVSNENRPVILHVFNEPDWMVYQKRAWQDWCDIVRTNDPTRPWISSDGEDDGEGVLPTTVGHYGDRNSLKEWAAKGKPWGVGETSMAYYGTPEQVSKFNGERAYESMEGRMEGLARESYHLIREQREAGASYSSVFNIAWYALQPLPFGKRDISASPSINDGVRFGEYRQGKPGVQPERIGAYSSTFNPGYDPTLPLYRTWPMFDAIKAANAGVKPAWSPWSETPALPAQSDSEEPAKRYDAIVFAGKNDSPLKRLLEKQGVTFASNPTNNGTTLFIVDAGTNLDDGQVQTISRRMNEGADILLWGITPSTLGSCRALLPLPLELDARAASSFIPSHKSWMKNLNNSDFYFCEVQRADASLYTLKGKLTDEGQTLLSACKTDWRKWNKRPEELKTAAVLRSENEQHDATPVFIKYSAKHSDVYVSTLTEFANSEKGFKTLSRILDNAGIERRKTTDNAEDMFFVRDDLLHFPANAKRKFKKTDDNMLELDFWIWSARVLDNLLLEPDMPKVSLIVEAQENSLSLNGKPVKRNIRNRKESEYKELPLQQGWNHFVLKIGEKDRNEFKSFFNCNIAHGLLEQGIRIAGAWSAE